VRRATAALLLLPLMPLARAGKFMALFKPKNKGKDADK
jgi:hypothetical protein